MESEYRLNTIKRCAKWLGGDGATFSQDSRLSFKCDNEGKSVRAECTGNMGKGTVLLSIAPSKCVHPAHPTWVDYGMQVALEKVSAMSAGCGLAVANEDATFGHNLGMTVLLMREMCKAGMGADKESPWRYYIDTLPREESTPVYSWTDQDLAHAVNTELAAQASEWRHALDTAYTKVIAPLFETHGEEFQAHLFSEQRQLDFFRKCAGLVWSRALPLPCSTSSGAASTAQNSGEPALMPLIDLFNGRPEGLASATLVEGSDGNIQVVTTQYIYAGDEIYLSYGAASTVLDTHGLRHFGDTSGRNYTVKYGVTDAETAGKNPYDSVRLDIAPLFPLSSALGDTELLQAKLDLLKHFGFPLGTANTTIASSSRSDSGSDSIDQECITCRVRGHFEITRVLGACCNYYWCRQLLLLPQQPLLQCNIQYADSFLRLLLHLMYACSPYAVHHGACTLLPLALRQVAAVLAVSSVADLTVLKQKGSIDSRRVSEAVAGNLVLQVVDHRLNSYPTLSRGADLKLLRAAAKFDRAVIVAAWMLNMSSLTV
eukprot:13066-Heterococcus_DN1.PRE.1